MRFKDVFSIIGPAMIGPSSSHTAGAVRLGRVARGIFGHLPKSISITFYGSFVETHKGHGTDVAIIGGLLDYDTDDTRIPYSLDHAKEQGIHIDFKMGKNQSWHPNTAGILLYSEQRKLQVVGSSIGGGNIQITSINEFNVEFTGTYPTLIIFHEDRSGVIASITHILERENMNIAHIDLDRIGRSSDAITVIEVDSPISNRIIKEIKSLHAINEVRKIDLTERGNP